MTKKGSKMCKGCRKYKCQCIDVIDEKAQELVKKELVTCEEPVNNTVKKMLIKLDFCEKCRYNISEYECKKYDKKVNCALQIKYAPQES